MRYSTLIAFGLLILGVAILSADQGVKVTYLANEGFLIEAGQRKILIDALFGDGIPGYPVVPVDTRKQLEGAQGRFSDVDVVLASHFHADHFSAPAVGNYLLNNTNARFYSTRDAEDKLQKTFRRYSEIQDRVYGVWPDIGGRNTFERDGVRLTALNLHHGEGTGAQNVGWLIEMDGVRLLHVGDTEVTLEDVKPYHLVNEKIDVAFLPSWFYVYDKFKQVISEVAAEEVVVMHLANSDAPVGYFGDAGSFQGVLKQVGDLDPNAWIPLKSLDSRQYE